MLLASFDEPMAASTDAAETALAQAEIAIAKARVHDALWSTAWKALLEARRSRSAQDQPGTLRWSARAAELAALGLTQAGYANESTAAPPADTNGEKR